MRRLGAGRLDCGTYLMRALPFTSSLHSQESARAKEPMGRWHVGRYGPTLFFIYMMYLVLFAFAPFTPNLSTSVGLIELYQKKFQGFSGILHVTGWDIWTNILLFFPYWFLSLSFSVLSFVL